MSLKIDTYLLVDIKWRGPVIQQPGGMLRFSNKPYDFLVSGILITDVSDHFPVFYIAKHMNPRNKKIEIKRETLITSDKNINNLKKSSSCSRLVCSPILVRCELSLRFILI